MTTGLECQLAWEGVAPVMVVFRVGAATAAVAHQLVETVLRADQTWFKYNVPFVFPKNPGSIPAYDTTDATAPLRAS